MNITYPLNASVFQTEEDYKEALQAVKSKQITVEDVQLLITNNVKQLYNSLVAFFFGSEQINHNNIFKREIVIEKLNEYCKHDSHLFHILLQNDLIGVCGRGYTFEVPRFKHNEEEYNRIIELNFMLGFCF
jgi:hypothetical protein